MSRKRSLSREDEAHSKKQHIEEYDDYSSDYSDEEDILPILDYENEIIENIKNNQVVIMTGETGSGKSTQIPQMLYRHGLLKNGGVAVSQPRRVAAVNLARHVADEMHCKLGDEVGYSIRFDDNTSNRTIIKYITDGCLIREFFSDSQVSNYSVIMLDEAHDRSINTDILFGLCKNLLPKRPDLRLIITSATLDIQQFHSFYPGSITMEIPGRLYPVAIFHSKDPISASQDEAISRAVDTVKKIHKLEMGHILVFLPGQYEIEKAKRLIEDWFDEEYSHYRYDLRVFPLYAALPAEQQALVFQPVHSNTRKVVIATNIAETSVTVSGIRYVIDPGYTKEKSYDAHTGMDSLDIVKTSKAAAQQRAGRAGRTGPGKCFRLYDQQTYECFTETTLPEIKRCSLLSTALYLKVLGIDDVLNFDFIDPPDKIALSVALKQLYILGALDEKGQITSLGKRLSYLPLDPSLAKMLYLACDEGCAEEAMIICAMLSVERIFYSLSSYELHTEKGKRIQRHQQRFISELGDQFTYLNVFMKYHNHGEDRYWCEENGIHYRSMRTAMSIYKQLKEILLKNHYDLNKKAISILDALQSVIAKGCCLNIARRCANDCYRTLVDIHENGGTRIGDLHPSSALVLSNQYPRYIVYQELVASNRSYFRNCCEVKEDDIVDLLKMIKGMKSISLSGGSDLVFYTQDGKKIETEQEKIEQQEEVKQAVKSTIQKSDIEAARLRYLQRKGLI